MKSSPVGWYPVSGVLGDYYGSCEMGIHFSRSLAEKYESIFGEFGDNICKIGRKEIGTNLKTYSCFR